MTAAAKVPFPGPLPWALLAGAALLLEGKAAWEFLGPPPGAAAPLLPLLLLHVAACALLAASLRALRRGDGAAAGFAAFVFVFCLSLPALGMLGVLAGVLPALGDPRPEAGPAFGVLRRVRARSAGIGQGLRYGPGGFRARLLARGIPAPRRLGQLLALRRRSTPHGNRLLREMLRDPADELRLAAYAVLERREKESQAAIALAEAAAREAGDGARQAENGARRLAALRRLAFLHWEAAYQELADGEVSRHHLERALEAAEAARGLAPGDGPLAFLKGRILIRLGEAGRAPAGAGDASASARAPAEAEAAVDEAAGAGIPGARLLPHLAEAAFRRGDFAAVRRHLGRLAHPGGPGAAGRPASGGPLDAVLRFWLGPGA